MPDPKSDAPSASSSGSSRAQDTAPAKDAGSEGATSPAPVDVLAKAASAEEPSSSPRSSTQKDKNPACPTCAGHLERYVGTNIHKLLTGWCEKCGVRHHLDAAT